MTKKENQYDDLAYAYLHHQKAVKVPLICASKLCHSPYWNSAPVLKSKAVRNSELLALLNNNGWMSAKTIHERLGLKSEAYTNALLNTLVKAGKISIKLKEITKNFNLLCENPELDLGIKYKFLVDKVKLLCPLDHFIYFISILLGAIK